MPDFGIAEALTALAALSGESFLGATAAAAPELAAAAAPEALGGAAELTAAGLPFAAGAGELGSVATGLGPAGVSAFDVAAPALTGAAAAGGLAGADALASAGLPLGAGVGATGSVDAGALSGLLAGGTGVGAAGDLAGLGDAALPANSTLTSGTGGPTINTPTTAPGVTSTGPTAGTPAGPLSAGTFDSAAGSVAPAAPGAVAPVGTAGAAPTDLASASGSAGATGAGKLTDAASSSGGFLDKLVSGATKSVENNWLPAAIAGGGLAYNVLGKNSSAGIPSTGTSATNLSALANEQQQLGATAVSGVANQQQLASDLTGTGKSFTNYLPSGTLPPDQQSALDNATASAKQRIISNYAGRGLPTDPAKNSSLAAELSQVDQQSLATKAQIEQQLLTGGTQLIGAGENATNTATSLLNTGLNATGLSDQIYNQLVGIDQTNSKAISDAIAGFAKAIGGTGGGVSLKLA